MQAFVQEMDLDTDIEVDMGVEVGGDAGPGAEAGAEREPDPEVVVPGRRIEAVPAEVPRGEGASQAPQGDGARAGKEEEWPVARDEQPEGEPAALPVPTSRDYLAEMLCREHPLVAGKAVDTVRFLRGLNHVPSALTGSLRGRFTPIDCSRRLQRPLDRTKAQEEEEPRQAHGGDDDPFAEFGDDGGDEAVAAPEDEDGADDDTVPGAAERLAKLEAELGQVRELARELLVRGKAGAEAEASVTKRVGVKMQHKQQLVRKMESAVRKAQVIARMRARAARTKQRRMETRAAAAAASAALVESKTESAQRERQRRAEERARRAQEDADAAAERQAKAREQRGGQAEARRAREEAREAELQAGREEKLLRRVAALEAKIGALMAPGAGDHGDEAVAGPEPEAEAMPDPLEGYWDGRSGLKGVVFDSKGELFVWPKGRQGMLPRLPDGLEARLLWRELARKKKNKLKNTETRRQRRGRVL